MHNQFFREGFWKRPEFLKLGCASMPFSFRVCRKSCGYCSTNSRKSGAIYDFTVATNHKRCSSLNQAFAIDISKHKTGKAVWNSVLSIFFRVANVRVSSKNPFGAKDKAKFWDPTVWITSLHEKKPNEVDWETIWVTQKELARKDWITKKEQLQL